MECAHFLFQNPDFDGSMMYGPLRLYDECGTQEPSRVYTEVATGEEWHYQQVSLNHQVNINDVPASIGQAHQGHDHPWYHPCD